MNTPPKHTSAACAQIERWFRSAPGPSDLSAEQAHQWAEELAYARRMIQRFAAMQTWAAETWKNQDHIKPLFDYVAHDWDNKSEI